MTATNERALMDAAEVLVRRVGMRLDPSERGRLSRCVVAAAHAQGLDVTTYVAQLDSDPVALQGLLDQVTVQETAFFRDQAQFDALANSVLPALEAPVTVWSAACSNGQEAYTVAMVLEELAHEGSRVIATDISTRAIERTRRAHYSRSEISGLSAGRRDRFLIAVDGGFEVIPKLRSRVEVRHYNLATDAPPFAPGTCPIVLCRNVLIYFSHAEIVRFLNRLADWMAPGGWLFLGYSESLWQVTERFELVRVGDAFLYRRAGTRSDRREDGPPLKPQLPNGNESRPSRQQVARRRASATPPATPSSLARSARAARAIAQSNADEASKVEVATLMSTGEAAVQAGDHGAAITAFRKYAYLHPAQPIAHLHLGLALDKSGDTTAARRAYAAARTALGASETAMLEATLEGYGVDELIRLLDMKLAGS